MPIKPSIDVEQRRVFIEVSGSFSLDQIFESIHRIVEHPDFQPGFDVLSDHTQVTEFLTSDQARSMAAHLSSLSRYLAGTRWAVVTVEPTSHGMLRMVSALVEHVPITVSIFRSHDEANLWLAELR